MMTAFSVDGIPPTVSWHDGALRLIDQRLLPGSLCFLDCRSVAEVCEAIRTMAVRGAPALGATGAYGIALAGDLDRAREAADELVATRPTAVNLAWGVRRALSAYEAGGRDAALAEAHAVAAEDVASNEAIGGFGLDLVSDDAKILTHCNAGHLACVGYGTAVGVIRAAAEAGRRPFVWVDETRPVLQGARLTAWELDRLGIDSRLVADSVAGSLMARGEVDLVVVGADRIAANGDVANKIGTYSLSVLAAHHEVSFYVAAPISTIDLSIESGEAIPIETRDEREVLAVAGNDIAPAGMSAHNPAFDVTPAALVTAIITDCGIARAPYDLKAFVGAQPGG